MNLPVGGLRFDRISARRWLSVSKPATRRVHPAPSVRSTVFPSAGSHLPGVFLAMPAASTSIPPGCGRPEYGSRASGPRFACGVLQIPPRDGHPCRPANRSSYQAGKRLPLSSECALPGAPKKTADAEVCRSVPDRGGRLRRFPLHVRHGSHDGDYFLNVTLMGVPVSLYSFRMARSTYLAKLSFTFKGSLTKMTKDGGWTPCWVP